MPSPQAAAAWQREFADALLFTFPKHGQALERDFKWLGSHRYGIVHLGGHDVRDLRERCRTASARLGWPLPYVDATVEPARESTIDQRSVGIASGPTDWTAHPEPLPAK